MSAAPSPERPSAVRASSSWPAAAPCFSTKSAICRWNCSPSCCARCRSVNSAPSAARSCGALQARIIAASNQDLEAAVAARRFREDLYFRLRVIPISAAAARTARGYSRTGGILHRAGRTRHGRRVSAVSREALEMLGGTLAGQRPGAGKLRAAGRAARARQYHSRRGHQLRQKRHQVGAIRKRRAGRWMS